MQDLQPLIDSLQGFAQKRLGFERPPKLFLKQDEENAKNILGKTAYYDPQEEAITIFTTARHPKDILRSYAHELVHHTQNLRGDLSPEKCGEMGMGYAQNNPHMREMERQAYEQGNLCFRDWEDNYKLQITVINIDLKENKKMAIKISKNELKNLIGKLLKERKTKLDEMPDPMPLRQGPGEFEKRQQGQRDLAAGGETFYGGKEELGPMAPEVDPAKAASQQRNLRKAGFKTMAQLQAKVGAKKTGKYDAQTMAAIKAFQTKIGVEDDGVYGRGTARAAKKQGGMMAKSKGGLTPGRTMAQRTFSGSDDTTLGDEEGLVRQMDASDMDIAAIKQNIKKDRSTTSNQAELDDLMAAAGGNVKDRSRSKRRLPQVSRSPVREEIDSNVAETTGLGDQAKSWSDKPELGTKGAAAMVRSMLDMFDDDNDGFGVMSSLEKLGMGAGEGNLGGEAYNALSKVYDALLDSEQGEVSEGESQDEFAKNRPPYDKATAADRAGDDGEPKNESKIVTPEQEEQLFESRFGARSEEVYNKLKKLWTVG